MTVWRGQIRESFPVGVCLKYVSGKTTFIRDSIPDVCFHVWPHCPGAQMSLT